MKAVRSSFKVLPAAFDRLELFCRQQNVSMSSAIEILLADRLGFEMPGYVTVFGSATRSHLTPSQLLTLFNHPRQEDEILPGYLEL